jgi:hypothetical protein
MSPAEASSLLPGVGLSKIGDYLVDNVYCNRLSYFRDAINDKNTEGPAGSAFPGLERETWGTRG